jgi:hypothetical protein
MDIFLGVLICGTVNVDEEEKIFLSTEVNIGEMMFTCVEA